MNSNIHNTNVDKIKLQVNNLINDINSHPNLSSEELENKYHYLFTTSKTLFNLIIAKTKKSNFDKQAFDKNLSYMLSNITKIQQNEITQDNASENVGKLLAKQYIPQYK